MYSVIQAGITIIRESPKHIWKLLERRSDIRFLEYAVKTWEKRFFQIAEENAILTAEKRALNQELDRLEEKVVKLEVQIVDITRERDVYRDFHNNHLDIEHEPYRPTTPFRNPTSDL